MSEMYQHLRTKAENTEEDTRDNARVLAKMICSLKDRIKMFGKYERKVALDGMKQIQDRVVVCPIHVDKMSEIKWMHATQCLIF